MVTHTLNHTLPLRLITHNIRYANPQPVPHEALWSTRGPKLTTQLLFTTATHPTAFICLQEALATQVADIHTALGPSWSYIGVGRDDGIAAGEFSPVFYNADTWECQRSRTYWLSPTPEKPSRGWDAALPRVVTMGLFRHRAGTGARVVVMSTHFDHRGVKAREESARLILELAERWVGDAAGGGAMGRPTVFLGGDFNSSPRDGAYRTVTAPGTGMVDISGLIPKAARYGNELTYSSFGEKGEMPKRIDFLFVKNTADVKFHTFGVLANRFDDGIYLSDHRAVVADMDIPVKGQSPIH